MCTGIRFVDDNGNMYFGRNLDWSCSYGEKAVIAPTSYAAVPIDGKTNIAAYEFPCGLSHAPRADVQRMSAS